MLAHNHYPWSFARIRTNTVTWPAEQILSASAWGDASYTEDTQSVSGGARSPPTWHYEVFFTLHTLTTLKRSQGHGIELPLNPSASRYYHYLSITTLSNALVSSFHPHSHFHIAPFPTHHQKHECCRDQQWLCAHFRNKTPNSVVFVKLEYYPAHLCSNKPGQENYTLLAIFGTEDFLKSCMQQHFSYTSTFLLV